MTNTFLADTLAQFRASKAACEALLATNPTDDVLMIRSTGLCVGVGEKNEYYLGGALFAAQMATPDMPEEAYAYVPCIEDGRGEKAYLVKRTVALKTQITNLEKSIAVLEAA